MREKTSVFKMAQPETPGAPQVAGSGGKQRERQVSNLKRSTATLPPASGSKMPADISTIFGYMSELDVQIISSVFADTAVTRALYQGLSDLEQMIVVRLAFMKQPVSDRLIRLWMNPSSESQVKKALGSLRSKHIVTHKYPDEGKPGEVWQYLLQPSFQTTFQSHLLSGTSTARCGLLGDASGHNDQPPTASKTGQSPSWDTLQEHSANRWNLLLRWMMSNEARQRTQAPDTSDKFRCTKQRPCNDLAEVLMRKSLVSPDEPTQGKTGGMSREAFSWLLKDLQSQICSLVVELLLMIDGGMLTNCALEAKNTRSNRSTCGSMKSSSEKCEEATVAIKEILTMMLTLSQSSIGQVYPLRALTANQCRFLAVAVDMGLVWLPEPHCGAYYVAPYCLVLGPPSNETAKLMTLISSRQYHASQTPGLRHPGTKSLLEHYIHPKLLETTKDDTSQSKEKDKTTYTRDVIMGQDEEDTGSLEAAIIVQSNFKVYVYTSSTLQASILGHLCELQARTPNLIVGLLTRDSVLAAYRTGISADQIIRFLNAHVHPALHDRQARSDKTFLPDNVVMQLKMWEQERRRVKLQPAILFKNWDTPELYHRCVRYAINRGIMLYHTPMDEPATSQDDKSWQKRERYLAVYEDSKDDMIKEIRITRDQLLN